MKITKYFLLALAPLMLGACASKPAPELPMAAHVSPLATLADDPANFVAIPGDDYRAPAPSAPAPKPLAAKPASMPSESYIFNSADSAKTYFEYGSAALTPAYKRELDAIAATLKNTPNARISVEGHTDNVSSAKFNLELSSRRARAVAEYLVSQGINPDNITSIGYGEARPITGNDTAAGRALNRRVEIRVTNGGLQ